MCQKEGGESRGLRCMLCPLEVAASAAAGLVLGAPWGWL